MAQTLLVALNRQAITKLVEVYDEQELDLRVVLLAKFSSYSDERIVLASPYFRQHPGIDYPQFGEMRRKAGLDRDEEELPNPLILGMTDPVVLALQRSFGTFNNPRGLNIGYQTLGDRYLEDGYLFRVRP